MQRVKKGDTVEVLGGDDRGRRGEVNSVPVSYTHLDVYKRQRRKCTS